MQFETTMAKNIYNMIQEQKYDNYFLYPFNYNTADA